MIDLKIAQINARADADFIEILLPRVAESSQKCWSKLRQKPFSTNRWLITICSRHAAELKTPPPVLFNSSQVKKGFQIEKRSLPNLALEDIFGRTFREFLIPHKNDSFWFIWSILVVVITDKYQFRVFGIDVKGCHTAIAGPSLIFENTIQPQQFVRIVASVR